MFETATGIDELSSDDAQLTPIFNALVRGVGDPDEGVRRDPLDAPLPAGSIPAQLRAVTGWPTVAEPRRSGDAVCSPARARHAAPVAGAVNAPTVSVRRPVAGGLNAPTVSVRRPVAGALNAPTVSVRRPVAGAHRAAEPAIAGPGRGGRHRALRTVSHGIA